jgi:ABC-type transporter Mla subunit MlaD
MPDPLHLRTCTRVMDSIHSKHRMKVLVLLSVVEFISIFGCTKPKDRTIQVRFPAAPGVREGASVRYLGVDVGRVEHIGFDSSSVLLSLSLQRPDVPIHRADRFEIVSAGLLGDHVIDIKPEPSSPLVSDFREILQGQDLKTRIVSVRLSPEEIDADTLLSALKEVLDASPQDRERVAEKWRNWMQVRLPRSAKIEASGPDMSTRPNRLQPTTEKRGD